MVGPLNRQTKYSWLKTVVMLLGLFLVMPAIALGWPTNHLDSSQVGKKPYCTTCHAYNTGFVNLEKINGVTPLSSSVTVNRNSSFTVDFRAIGLGYGRFTVSGAILVPDTNKWVLSTKPGGNVPWFVAEQDTSKGAPLKSPFIWSTAFSDNDNPNAQKGVTLDDGTAPPAPFVDRNLIAHDEEFSVRIFVDETVPYGTYKLKFWGVGTASNGVLGYNEKTLTVNVFNDTTPPNPPGSITFSNLTTSSVRVNWGASTDSGSGMNGYEIYRSSSVGGPYEYIGYTPHTNELGAYFSDSELLPNTTYYYKVNAVDNAGNITWGGSAGVTTLAGARVDSRVPTVPEGLKAFLVNNPLDESKKIVKLTWTSNAEADIDKYRVYRASSATGFYALLAEVPPSSFENLLLDPVQNIVHKSVYHIDNEIRYGTSYYYKVRAVDLAGKESELTTYVSSTPAVDFGDSNPHGNYKAKNGMCQNCHSLHSASGKELIYFNNITNSCYTCHDGSQSKYNTKAAYDPLFNPSHHKIPEGRYSCDACHNPHYSAEADPEKPDLLVVPRLLGADSMEDGEIKRSGNEFCWACHGTNSKLQNPFGRDHRTAFEVSRHNSLSASSLATGIVCRNCHVPHGSRDYPLLVSANSENFCISCHKNVGFTQTKVRKDPSEGSVYTGVYLNNFSNDYLGTQHHKNFYGRNTCTMCHDPHGSIENRYMLKYPYSDYWKTTTVGGRVYGPVEYADDVEEDMVCFRCHDSQYYSGINGDYTRVTLGSRFGNGNAKNYHDHTAKLKISCRACHDPHTGKSALHDTNKPAGFEWILNNDHDVNFDWAVQVSIATYSSFNNRLAFIPKYDTNFNVAGYSCAIKCHNKDHYKSGGNFQSYSRTSYSPPVKCNGCHDFDDFDTNSRHPVLGPISPGGHTIDCESCHLADHKLHNKTNPYGLKDTIVTNWVYNGSPRTITTTLEKTNDPITGREIPNYSQLCYQCHGPVQGRDILGDHKTHYEGKPHSLFERTGKDNPYGAGLDTPCLTCHYNHSSTNMRLLRNVIDGVSIDAETITGKINACLSCHDGSPALVDISIKYNAPSSAGHFIKEDPSKKMLCTECHDSHGTTNKMYLLDTTNKYNTGITFEGGRTGEGSRWFCLACHPLADEEPRPYDTTNTVGAGIVMIQPLPAPERLIDHTSAGTRECAICHDPHKPWPATGGEDRCYECHSRPNGEATDIKSLAGLASQPGTGLLSKHRIIDGMSSNNTCMIMCHEAHPHSKRADHLKHIPNVLDPLNPLLNNEHNWEKNLCISCHNSLNPKSPYVIDVAKYDLNPHNYSKPIRIYPADGTSFYGNCDKCHMPHGSNFKPLLRQPKDLLCVGCHNGVETDGEGDIIPDIKTLYENAGHWYTDYPTAKLYCDECHIPHGSTSSNFLRDSAEMAPRQSITLVEDGVAQKVYFPDNLSGENYSTRLFCGTCHREYVAEDVHSWVYYSSETTPGGIVKIKNIPIVGANGIQINEHKTGETKACTACHNPHDREPFGHNENCFICHGANGYATQIERLTGLNGTWPEDTVAKKSYHPIRDAGTTDANDCMKMCHTEHVHNPRANLIKDKRAFVTDVTAPGAPTVNAVASSANQIDLKISAPADKDIVGYYVYRSPDNISWSLYGTINSKIYAPASLWYYDGGLAKDQTLYYKVQAFDRKGNISAFSSTVSATTAVVADTTKPDIPLNIVGELPTKEAMRSSSINLTWSPSRDNYELKGYNIYRATANPDNLASFTLIGSTGLTSFTDGSLTENTTYYYRIASVDAVGNESGKSSWVSVKTEQATATVRAGYYQYIDGSDTLYMHIYRPEDSSLTPVNVFMNSSKMKVVLDVPQGYFNFGAVDPAKDIKEAKLTLYSDSRATDRILGGFAKSTVFDVRHAVYRDQYSWLGQVPATGSLYQLTVNMSVYQTDQEAGPRLYSKQLVNREIVYSVPTTRTMKTYKNSDYTGETLVFKPGDTVYVIAPSDYPGGNYSGQSVALYGFKGGNPVTSNTSLLNTNYDQNTGHVKFSLTLPGAGSLTQNSWYHIGAVGNYGSTRLIDIYQQILVRTPDTTVPTTPTGVSVSGNTENKVSLIWNASNDNVGVAGYKVYRKKSTEGQYTFAGAVAPDTLYYDVSGLEPDTTYNFYVVAYDAVGNVSTASAVANQKTNAEGTDTEAPVAPVKVRLVVNSASSISVLWDWNATSRLNKVTSYSVFRSRNAVEYRKVGSVNSVGLTSNTTVSLTDNSLFDNTQYYYKVVAHDKVGNTSSFSEVVTKTTKSSGENSIEGALCMSCHDGVAVPPADYAVTTKIGTAYNLSKHNVDVDIKQYKDGSIYRGNCTKCHIPHGSDYDNLLRQEDDVDLCFLCHETASESGKFSGKRDYLSSAHGPNEDGSYKYSSATSRFWPGGVGVDSPVKAKTEEDAGMCYNCHAPHGRYDPVTGDYIKSSAWAGNSENLNRLCFTCHNDNPDTFYGEWHGKTVYSATRHGDPAYNAKMKATDNLGEEWGAGECAICHDPHGTQNPAMLRMPVNASGENMNLMCLKCHDQDNILVDTGLFDGSQVYVKSKHGMKAQWIDDYNDGDHIYNKTSFLPGVCLNCHNSHGKSTDNSADASKVIPKMLVIEDGEENEICNKCHEHPDVKEAQPGYVGNDLFRLSAHKGVGSRPGALWPGGRYYEEPHEEETRGKCTNCHDPHGTAKRDWFGNVIHMDGETFDEEEELCYTCHQSGVVLRIYDLKQFKDSGKYTGHMPWMTVNVHSFDEDLNSRPRHVECQDCHNTHAVESTFGITSLDERLPKVLKGTWGVKITSWPTPNAPNYTATGAGQWREKPVETDPSLYPYEIVNSNDPEFEEYMLCFKCHASYAPDSGGKRIMAFLNPNNSSTHGFNPFEKNPTNFMSKALQRKVDGKPVADYLFTPGTPFNPNPDINVVGEPRRYKITCSDCHGNSDPNGPKGPHGSNFDYLLKRDPKSVTFCTDCHYSTAYVGYNGTYGPYSFGFNTQHGHGYNYSGGVSWTVRNKSGSYVALSTILATPDQIAVPAGVEYIAKVNQMFGSNWCRVCHYAGQYWGDTQNVTVHGANASYPTQRNFYGTNTYTIYRGLNGYGQYFTTTNDGLYNFSGCSTQNTELGLRTCSTH